MPIRRRMSGAGAPRRPTDAGLDDLALRVGEPVRFRRRDRRRWQEGVVAGRERDGSVAVHDRHGAARAVAADTLMVRRRGRSGWEPLADRLARHRQLPLF